METFFDKIGGAATIDKLVDEFYHIMSTDPKARECFLTHSGRDIKVAATKLKAFLSGWLGGPALYIETYGHPRLRMRHFPFSIGPDEVRQWLYCMELALLRVGVPDEERIQVMEAFERVTTVIKNRG